jgi:hypothetical protein
MSLPSPAEGPARIRYAFATSIEMGVAILRGGRRVRNPVPCAHAPLTIVEK